MTVLESLRACVDRLNGVRLPAVEAVNVIIISTVANDIQACIDTLQAHAADGAEATEKTEGEAEKPEETGNAEEDLFGEAEQTEEREAGGEDDKRSDV